MAFHRLILLVLLIFFSACASSNQIKPSGKIFETEASVLSSPQGSGWQYQKNKGDKIYTLIFQKPSLSATHSTSATYLEFVSYTTFANPEHFLKYIRHLKEGDIDSFEYKVVKQQWILDNRFGEYSLHYYIVLKHTDPARMNPNDYTLLKRYGYLIRHPYMDNIIIDIFYDEEGKPVEINPSFEQTALTFIQGLRLKKKE